jgi:hypothetical protein
VGSQGGLAWFFPTLPATAERHATAVWNVPYASGQSSAAVRVEATRGKRGPDGAAMAAEVASEPERVIPTTYTRAEVRLAGARDEGAARVSVFQVTAEYRVTSVDPFPSTFEKTWQGTYEVTSAGRVLRAHVEAKRTTTMGDTASGAAPQHDVEDTDAKMHLVRACDGPVAPSIEPVLTDAERAQPVDDRLRIEVAPPPRKKP